MPEPAKPDQPSIQGPWKVLDFVLGDKARDDDDGAPQAAHGEKTRRKEENRRPLIED
jgi:hypothetical protein